VEAIKGVSVQGFIITLFAIAVVLFLISKVTGANRSETREAEHHPSEVTDVSDDSNPAFSFLRDNHSLDARPYPKIADLLYSSASEDAEKLASLNGVSATAPLVHFFYDLYLALNSGLFQGDKVVASATIDGIHIKHFGQPSHEVIDHSLKIIAEGEKDCFLVTFFSVMKKEDYVFQLSLLASYCMTGNPAPPITQVGRVSDHLTEMIVAKSKVLKEEITRIVKINANN